MIIIRGREKPGAATRAQGLDGDAHTAIYKE